MSTVDRSPDLFGQVPPAPPKRQPFRFKVSEAAYVAGLKNCRHPSCQILVVYWVHPRTQNRIPLEVSTAVQATTFDGYSMESHFGHCLAPRHHQRVKRSRP